MVSVSKGSCFSVRIGCPYVSSLDFTMREEAKKTGFLGIVKPTAHLLLSSTVIVLNTGSAFPLKDFVEHLAEAMCKQR